LTSENIKVFNDNIHYVIFSSMLCLSVLIKI